MIFETAEYYYKNGSTMTNTSYVSASSPEEAWRAAEALLESNRPYWASNYDSAEVISVSAIVEEHIVDLLQSI